MRRRSLTIEQKSNCIQQFNCQNDIKVYLRKPNRHSTIIRIAHQLCGKNFLTLASQKTNITISSLVLFHKGQKIQNNPICQDKNYQFYQNDIVHVHEVSRSKRKSIQITLKPFQCCLQQITMMQVVVNEKIGICLSKCFDINSDLVFVESGRKLNLSKTFEQEYIENQSTIIVTSFSQQKKRYNIQKIQKTAIVGSQNKQKSFQYEDIRQFNSAKMLRKTVSWSSTENFNTFNFKKKQKPSIYKSQRISQGKQIIWESDSSSDIHRKLRKKLAIKKNKQQKQIKQERITQLITPIQLSQDHIQISDQEDDGGSHLYRKQRLFSSHDKLQLQKQLKKLLFSDMLDQKSKEKEKSKQKQKQKQKIQQMIELQPPQMQTDDFLQMGESQQLIIREDIDSDDDQQEEEAQISMARQLIVKTPINLRQSIGKSKGTFMVPTTDLVKN